MSIDQATPNRGLPLLEAARKTGVRVTTEAAPRSAFVDSDGVKLHYLDWDAHTSPTAAPMLLLHGFAQNAHSWDFVTLAFAGQRRVIALDQRGHGDSGWAADGDYTPDAAQRDLDVVVDTLGLKKMLLVGLSMGGRNAFTFAARRPEVVKALVIVDVGPEIVSRGTSRIREFTSQPDTLESFDAFVERTLRYSPRREEWRIRGSLANSLKQLPDGRWTWKYDPVLRDPSRWGRIRLDPAEGWRSWRSIQAPTLIVRGAESDLLAVEVAQRMERELPGRATLAQVPEAGHLVPGDNPVAFEAELQRFLERVA